jgi:hypothetical protein
MLASGEQLIGPSRTLDKSPIERQPRRSEAEAHVPNRPPEDEHESNSFLMVLLRALGTIHT